MKSKAFTLIELLVVIAIIGLLASIVLISVNNARAKTRDVKRLADFRQIQTALEMYYDNNESYPIAPNWGADDGANWALLVNALAPNYLNAVPQDPLFNGTYPWVGNAYHYQSLTGKNWSLVTENEKLGYTSYCARHNWCCGSWLIFCK